MENLIDISYFIGERDIPNTQHADVVGRVEQLIKDHQEEYLTRLLGYEFYLLFEAGLDVTAPTEPAQIWLDLRDGKAFTGSNGIPAVWRGFLNAETLKSPLADYCYYWWLRKNQTTQTGTGEVIADNQNSTITSAAYREAEAWNRMVDGHYALRDFLYVNWAVYPAYMNHMGNYEQATLFEKINAWGI